MELDAVQAALCVGERGVLAGARGGSRGKSFRKLRCRIAVGEPDDFLCGKPLEESALCGNGQRFFAELSVLAGRHFAAEHMRHCLVTVADAEHRYAECEDFLIGLWASLFKHRRRAAREDDALRVKGSDIGCSCVVRQDFGAHAHVPDPASDEVRELAAEVEDDDHCPEYTKEARNARHWRSALLWRP